MPGFDRTGPIGMGSMTGKGAGLCAGKQGKNFRNNSYRCVNRRHGGGYRQRGILGVFPADDASVMIASQEQELASLEAQKETYESQLKGIEKKINFLKNS
jgi:hypothetical protein